jgi:hypothetical protein
MKTIEVFYKRHDDFYSYLNKLNCTGKWKIVKELGYKDEKIFCEHKGFFGFTKWIDEDDIVFIETEHHNCNI